MTDFEKYVVEEHIEDFNDRVITRRELIRRVTLITGSTVATMGLLTAMGCSTEPTGEPVAPTSRTSDDPQDFATPPAQPTQDGVTVREDDSRIRVADLPVRGPDGAALIAYHASPATASAGGVLVIHENRGLVPHTKDVVRRVATAGFEALAVDLLSRDGGADKLTDSAAYSAALGKRPVDAMVADVRAALQALSASNGDRLGVTGFCFGGGMTWNALAAGVPMKAAVPFYGPAPANVAALATVKTAVFGVYAERDARITGTKDAVESALKQNGQPSQITVYPGVDHAFHNDTGARYNAAQAEAAWIATINWFRQHVR
jgi:carboxymethylenebutenolidase